MGVCCCKHEPILKTDSDSAGAQTNWAKELSDSEPILKLQEVELETQTQKSQKLTEELVKLQGKVRGADHVLLTSSEKQFMLKAVFELEEQSRELSKLAAALKKPREDCASIQSTLRTLVEASKAPAENFPTDVETMKRALTTLHNDLAHSHKSLKTVEDRLASLKQQHEEGENKRLLQIQARTDKFESVLKIPARWVSDGLRRSWEVWKVRPKSVIEQVESEGAVDESPKDLSPDWHPPETVALDPLLTAEFTVLRSSSPFAAVRPDQPPVTEALLERLLADAFVAHASDSSENSAFPQTLLSQLPESRSDATPAAALAAVVSLQSRPLGLLSASLLQVSQPAPFTNAWARKVSQVFATAHGLLVRQRRLQGESDPVVEFSSKVLLAELLSVAYTCFAGSPVTGEKFIASLKPAHLTDLDYALFVLSHKMRQKNTENLGLFKRIDTTGKGRIKLDQFVPGVRDVLGVWLSPEDLLPLVKDLAKGAGELSRVDFLKLNFKTYLANASSDVYAVSLTKALEALYETYVDEAKRVVAALREFMGAERTLLSDVEFFAKTRMLNSEITEAQMNSLWADLTELRSGGLSAGEAAVRVLLRHGLHPRC